MNRQVLHRLKRISIAEGALRSQVTRFLLSNERADTAGHCSRFGGLLHIELLVKQITRTMLIRHYQRLGVPNQILHFFALICARPLG